MASCGKIILVQWRDDHMRTFPARCGCWDCSNCFSYRRRKMQRTILAGHPDMFMTLTGNPRSAPTVAKRARLLVDAWTKLVRKIRKLKRLKHLPYFVKVEATKKGEPHLHIVMRCGFISQQWLSRQWQKLTGAFIVDVRRIHDQQQAAFYISKYLGKAPAQFGKLRRYWRSHHWELEPTQDHDPRWKGAPTRQLKGLDIAWIVTLMRDEGWIFIRAGPDYIEARAPYPGAEPPLWDRATEPQAFPKRHRPAIVAEAE